LRLQPTKQAALGRALPHAQGQQHMTTVAESNTAPTVQSWSVWHVDPRHSLAEFSARHMMLSKVRGQFTGVTGTVIDAADDPKYSSVKAEIDVTTLITGDPQRDEHLRSPDFFDVANHPTISFESRRVAGSREQFKVTGDLTIRGQTREVTLDVTFNGVATNPLGQSVAGFTAETHINRKDFGLNWNMALEAGGFLVGDDIKIEIELEAVRQAPASDAAN
jgi:polyisoprenoid-binding protein YceI